MGVARPQSLYNATPASWTNTNIVIAPAAGLAISVGGAGEFSAANIVFFGTSNIFGNGTIFGVDTANGSIATTAGIGNGNTFTLLKSVRHVDARRRVCRRRMEYDLFNARSPAGTLALGANDALGSGTITVPTAARSTSAYTIKPLA